MSPPVTVNSDAHELKKGRAVTRAPIFQILLLCMLAACSVKDAPQDSLEPSNLAVMTTTQSGATDSQQPNVESGAELEATDSQQSHVQDGVDQDGNSEPLEPELSSEFPPSEDLTLNENGESEDEAANRKNAISSSEVRFSATPTVGLLLPLSGPNQRIGISMWNAAQMAVFDINSPNLLIRPYDTQGDPEHAQQAARLAISEGANIFVGPLFSDSARSVASIAKQEGLPMVTFSNDQGLAESYDANDMSGLYVFGQLPSEQIVRVVDRVAPKTQGKFALISPQTPFGDTAAQTLKKALVSHEGRLVGAARYREGDLTSLETSVRALIDADRFEEEHRAALEFFRARLRYAIARDNSDHDVAIQVFDEIELEAFQAMWPNPAPPFDAQSSKQVKDTAPNPEDIEANPDGVELGPEEDTHPALEIELVPILKTFERYIETDPLLSLDLSFLDAANTANVPPAAQLTSDANGEAEGLFNLPASKDTASYNSQSPETRYTEPETIEDYREAFLRLRAANPYYEINFDALLIAEDPQISQRMVPILRTYDLGRKPVSIMGTGLWDGADLGRKSETLRGAIYAAPEARFRTRFEDRYKEAFKVKPQRLTTLSYDAVALVGLLAHQQQEASGSLHEDITSQSGFTGLDGLFRFRSNGLVERSIALHALTQDGSEIVDASLLQFDAVSDSE